MYPPPLLNFLPPSPTFLFPTLSGTTTREFTLSSAQIMFTRWPRSFIFRAIKEGREVSAAYSASRMCNDDSNSIKKGAKWEKKSKSKRNRPGIKWEIVLGDMFAISFLPPLFFFFVSFVGNFVLFIYSRFVLWRCFMSGRIVCETGKARVYFFVVYLMGVWQILNIIFIITFTEFHKK